MRPIAYRLSALAAVLLIAAGCDRGTAVAERVAVVNDRAITQQTFDAFVARRTNGTGQLSEADRKDLLEQVISIELLMQDALKQGIDRETRTAGELAVQRATLLANAAIRAHLDANPITEEAIKASYDAKVKELAQVEYKARHILVPSEAEAKDVLARLGRGSKFETLARSRSIDTGTAQQGGDLGWFVPTMMVKPFADAVLALGDGGLSKAPVQSQFGWHVILVEGKRDVPPPALEELHERLKGELQNQAVEAYINGLRGAAKIETVEPAVAAAEPAPEAEPATPAGG
jgi:peptidyl-prolyl cis-trans isomerase C